MTTKNKKTHENSSDVELSSRAECYCTLSLPYEEWYEWVRNEALSDHSLNLKMVRSELCDHSIWQYVDGKIQRKVVFPDLEDHAQKLP